MSTTWIKRRERLGLAVAEAVLAVGRHRGDAHRRTG